MVLPLVSAEVVVQVCVLLVTEGTVVEEYQEDMAEDVCMVFLPLAVDLYLFASTVAPLALVST